jgi:malonate transporter
VANPLLLLPDFLLILLGWVLCRRTALNRSVWDGVERLVYYLLFPVLLFNSIVRSPLQPAQLATLAAATLGTLATGIALALALGRWPGVDRRLHASGAQTAYRFNSYIGLAIAERLGGAQGLAWMAFVIAISVPVANIAAVWPLARHGGHSTLREIVRNPLVIATLAGLLANAVGLVLPDAVATTLQRIGVAALPLGLMAVGAGLAFGALKASPRLAAALLAIRHVALPIVAIALTAALALPEEQRAIVVLFAALPTSAAAYVLAARMGGDGGFVAGIVTVSTLLGMVGIPLWLAVANAVR